MNLHIPLFALAFATLGVAHGEGLLNKTKEIASSAGEIAIRTVNDTVDTVGKVTSGENEDPVKVRTAIDKMAEQSLAKLFSQDSSAKAAFEKSYGYAVFDSRVSSFGFTAGFGKGVAVKRNTDTRAYMKMATGGVNLGMGIQYFQVIFLFPDIASFDNFIKDGWDAGTDATAAAGKDGKSMALVLSNGVSVYQLNDTGIMLKTSLTGTKYWKWDELNAG